MEEYEGLTLKKLKQAINDYYNNKKQIIEMETNEVLNRANHTGIQPPMEGKIMIYDNEIGAKWTDTEIANIPKPTITPDGMVTIPTPNAQMYSYAPAYEPKKEEAPKFYLSKEENVFYRYDGASDMWIISDNERCTNHVSYFSAANNTLKDSIFKFKNDINNKF